MFEQRVKIWKKFRPGTCRNSEFSDSFEEVSMLVESDAIGIANAVREES
jgi:hypothetical protein